MVVEHFFISFCQLQEAALANLNLWDIWSDGWGDLNSTKEKRKITLHGLRAGPSGIKNFNPGIFRDGILPNPGIPGFFGTGFSNIFDPGILGKTFGIFRDFHFYFIRLSNWIIFSIFIITIVVTMHHALLPPFSGITLLLITVLWCQLQF